MTFSTKPFRLSRRTLLRSGLRGGVQGAGAVIALPWLEAMSGTGRQAHAAGAKRFVTWFTPNGSIKEAWNVPTVDADFTQTRIFKPLEAFKDRLVVIEGVDNVVATKPGPGDGHMKGMGCMLTGIELLPGKTLGGSGTPAGFAGGISVDQEIVAKAKPNTRFPSIELGVQAGSAGSVWGYSNYKGPGLPLPLDNSASSVWSRIFSEVGATPGDDSLFQRSRMQRKSVLNGVMANYRLWMGKMGADDRKRLDQHLTAIAELEKRVSSATVAPAAGNCVKPGMPPEQQNVLPKAPEATKLDYKSNDKFPEIGKLQMDLLAMALQCDLTRVATLQWENSVGGTRFTWLGASRGHHDMSHDPDDVPDIKELLIKINIWFSQQLAYLMGKLAAVQEGDSTLLDNSLILACNELSRGNSHSNADMPFVLAGRAGGKLKGGRYLKFPGTISHNNLLVSILNMFDVPATTFGNPMWCTGPLSGLVV